MAIKYPCVKCQVLTTKPYCPAHIPSWVTRKERPSPEQRGYNSEYRKNRKILLADNPPCNHCGRLGTKENPITADHIQSLATGGTNDLANLQPLCKQCNGRKQ